MYGDKVRYYSNDKNIEAHNFEKVLSYGRGIFLKLNNDTLLHRDFSLDKIIAVINRHIISKDIIFFSNGTLKNVAPFQCTDLDSFVKRVSFYSTWIACFGIWKKDFTTITNFNTIQELYLVNDVLFTLVNKNGSVRVDDSKIFDPALPAGKGGYNIYKVFGTNYLGLLEEYRQRKQISWRTLFNEKTRLFLYFLLPWSFRLWTVNNQYSFNKKGAFAILFGKYKFHPVLYLGIAYFFFKVVKSYIVNLIKK